MIVHLPVLSVYLYEVLVFPPVGFRLLRPVLTFRYLRLPSWVSSDDLYVYAVRFTGVLDGDHDLRHPVVDCYRVDSGDMEVSFEFRCRRDQFSDLYRFCLLGDLSSAVLGLRLFPDGSGNFNLNYLEVLHAYGGSLSRTV